MPRDIPPALLAHFRSPYRTLARCWIVRPQNGMVEAYTSLNRNLDLPAFDTVPALTYLCAGGVEATTIPARLNLSKSGVEVSVLAFDRGRLLRGYYRDAEFEAFIVNYRDPSMGRDVVVSGRLGAVEVGAVGANVELVPWPALAEMQIGRTCNQLCDVGLYPGEQFGTGRCRNMTLNDGPLREHWSADAVVTSVTSAHSFSVARSNFNMNGGPLPGGFDAHLVSGDVEFWNDAGGGGNAGASRQIKSASGAETVALELHTDLPFVPEIGDNLVLVAGCRRDASDCKFYNNIRNFQGFNLLPGKIGVLNEKTE